ADFGAISGKALTRRRRRRRQLRELRGNLDRGGSTGLLQMCRASFQGFIRGDCIFFQRIQGLVIKDGPPLAFGKGVFGSAFPPRFRDVPLRRYWGGGALIFWADGASADAQRESQKKNEFFATNGHFLAPGFAPDWAPSFPGSVGAAWAEAGFWLMSFILTC